MRLALKLTNHHMGIVNNSIEYAPFGETITDYAASGPAPRLGWIGKERDAETGHGNFGVRNYDFEGGRFLSGDALWESFRAYSPYHYSRNNVLRRRDPSGLAEFFDADGNLLVSDGNNDGLTYITTGFIVESNVSETGINFNGIINGDCTVLLPSRSQREQMLAAAERTRGDTYEEGGQLGNGKDGKRYVVEAESGPGAMNEDGTVKDVISVDPWNVRGDQWGVAAKVQTITGTYHSHPDGIATDENTGESFFFPPEVSAGDLEFSLFSRNMDMDHFVLGLGNNTVSSFRNGRVTSTMSFSTFESLP